MKIKSILNANQTLQELGEMEISSFKLTYAIAKLTKQFEIPMKLFNEKRDSLIVEFGQKDESGNSSIKNEDIEAMEKFNKGLIDILETDLDDDFYKIKMSYFDGEKIKPNTLLLLNEFIIDDIENI